MKQTNWFAVSMFLGGALLGGTAGVVRGDWLGKDAAQEVKVDLSKRIDNEVSTLKDDIRYIRNRLDELIRLQK